MSSLRTSAATGVMWTAIQIWTVRLTTAGAFIVLSRQLQPKEFGLVALAMAVIGVLSLFGDSGIPVYVQRARDLDKQTLDTAFWTTVGLGTLLAGALALLAVPVAGLFDSPGLTPVLQVLSIGLVLNSLNSIQSALLKRQMRFKTLAIRGTVATVVGSTVAITMALHGFGVWALVAQSLVRSAVSVVIIWTSVSWYPGLSWSRKKAKEIVSFGSQMLTISLLLTARDRGEDFILAGLGGTGVLGLWAVANRLVRIIQEVGGSVVASVATPAYAKLQDDPPRLFRAYSTSVASSGAVLFPAFLLLAVTSRDLVPLVLGRQWASTGEVAQIVALTMTVVVFSYFDRAVFVALDRMRPELYLVISSVTLQLGVIVVFARFGLLVLATALLVRAVVVVPTRMIALHRVTGMPWSAWANGSRVLVAAVVAAACAYLTLVVFAPDEPWLRCAIAFVVLLVLYPPVLWLVARPTVRSLMGDLAGLTPRRRRVVDLTAGEDETRRPADASV